MKESNKSAIKSIMTAAQNTYKSAIEKEAEIYGDPDLSDAAKIQRGTAAVEKLNQDISHLRDMLNDEKQKAVNELDAAKSFNSRRRLAISEYQNRLMLEADFIRKMPDSMGQDVLKERLSVFFGDEMAREYLTAVIETAAIERQARGVAGLTTSEILPDLYGVQYAAIEKLFSAIDDKMLHASSRFVPNNSEANEKEEIFMEGLFKGISDYLDSLPEKMERPRDTALKAVDFENIPAYATGAEDLEIIYSMYRA